MQTRFHVPDIGPETPFADALRIAIADRGLALHRIQARLAERGLRVGIATLSTWQSGRRLPRATSLAVVTALEELLELPTMVERIQSLPSFRLLARESSRRCHRIERNSRERDRGPKKGNQRH